MKSDMTIEVLRPCVSVIHPDSLPPTDRMKKHNAKMPAVASSCLLPSLAGKNVDE
jgi:hypothetical protein